MKEPNKIPLDLSYDSDVHRMPDRYGRTVPVAVPIADLISDMAATIRRRIREQPETLLDVTLADEEAAKKLDVLAQEIRTRKV